MPTEKCRACWASSGSETAGLDYDLERGDEDDEGRDEDDEATSDPLPTRLSRGHWRVL